MIQLLTGDCRTVLPTLPANSVHCVVTSPPYFGLRDYQTGTWEGGDAGCSHTTSANRDSRPRNGLTGGIATVEAATIQRGDCRCGARRIDAQIGLEATPDCGKQGYFRLRADLTEAQREYVVRRLLALERRDV